MGAAAAEEKAHRVRGRSAMESWGGGVASAPCAVDLRRERER
jgi:hypothetical protein